MPQVPLVVGLAGKIPDGVNNLIATFVGFQSKPAKEINKKVTHLRRGWSHWEDEYVLREAVRWLKAMKEERFNRHIGNVRKEIEKQKSIAKKREAFLELREWEQRYLITRYWYWMFPSNAKNLRFLNEQMVRLGFKTSVEHWEQSGPLIWYD